MTAPHALAVERLSKSFGGFRAVHDVSFHVAIGEVAALIGPNGAGKSTFIKTIIGQLAPLSGEVVIGANVQIGYFAQAHESLDPKRSVLDEILTIKPMGIAEARSYLGAYLFSGDDVFRPIETLSGGERGRVALAKLALTDSNFLLLDEPTNHLDIASQEVLQNVLADFGGTILLVSHDRYLIDALATQIWALSPGQMSVSSGGYQDFLAAREAARQREIEREAATRAAAKAASPAAVNAKKHGLNPFQLEKRLNAVESHITALERQLADLTEALGAASAIGDASKVRELGEQYNKTEHALQEALEEWELLAG